MDATDAKAGWGHRPEIDGLRGVAVVAVVMYHLGLGFRGGFAGVDVFFVISGYLITGILLRELEGGVFSFGRFWERRARRLFPALAAVLGFTLVVGWRMLGPREFESLGAQGISVLAMLANARMMTITGYWEPLAEEIPLMQTWSLAVEEQFYLVAPVLLFFMWRHGVGRQGVVLGSLCLASFGLMLASPPEVAFFMPHTRAWELLAGCALAWAEFRGWRLPGGVSPVAGWLGLGMVVVAVFGFDGHAGWPDARALLPTVGAALVLGSNSAGLNSAGRLLCWRPLVATGLVSYSLYLWHWPLLLFYRRWIYPGEMGAHDQVVLLVAMAAVSWGSWRWIEQPFRRRPGGSGGWRARPVWAMGCVWLLLWGVSVWIKLGGGFEAAHQARHGEVSARILRLSDGNAPEEFEAAGLLERGGVRVGPGPGPPRIVVLGDSHGAMVGPVLRGLAEERGVAVVFLTQSGTAGFLAGTNTHIRPVGMSNREKRRRDAVAMGLLGEWKPRWVLVAGKWDSQLRFDWAGAGGDSPGEFERALDQTLGWLEGLGCGVALVGQPPVLPLANRPNRAEIHAAFLARGGLMPVYFEPREIREARRRALGLFRARASGGVVALDPEPLFTNPDGSVRYEDGGGGIYYMDEDHLNALGAERLRGLFEPLFEEAAGGR